MERNIWKSNMSRHNCPRWSCPECSTGKVILIKDSFNSCETQTSKKAARDDYYPEDLDYGFSAWGICDNEKCQQKFCISGRGGLEQYPDGDGDYHWVEYFSPKYCFPMPKIIKIPKATPWIITAELSAAFSLFWLHKEACAGRIRVSIERLLDELGVAKEKTVKNNKSVDLTLHGRIELFTVTNASVGQILMALKWLGNSGSHSKLIGIDAITQDDLLDAFYIIEHALENLFDNRSGEVASISAKLHAKHKK